MGFEENNAEEQWEALWTGHLTEVFKSGSTVSLNVLYTLYIFKASGKVLIMKVTFLSNLINLLQEKPIQAVVLNILLCTNSEHIGFSRAL